MSFGDSIESCFTKYGTFAGRAARSEYWFFVLFSILIGIAATIFDSFVFGALNGTKPLSGFSSLALFLPGLAVTVRRLHDLDRSGAWAIPVAVVALWNLAVTLSLFPPVGIAHSSYAASLGLWTASIALLVYDLIFLVIMMFSGTGGPNHFGPDPLADDMTPDVTPASA